MTAATEIRLSQPARDRTRRIGVVAGRLARRYGIFLVVILIWEVVSRYLAATGTPDFVLPPPLTVAGELVASVQRGIIPSYLQSSMIHLFLAVTVGVCVGVVLGLLIGLNRWAARLFYPLLNFFQAIGGIALAPLLIIWFGFSTISLIVVVNYTVVFPIAFNTLNGVRTVPRIYVNAARTMGASPLQIALGVLLPGALPNVILGLRLAIAFGWRALIAVEMLFALDGLGFMIFDARQFLNTPQIIAGMVVLGIIWFLIDRLVITPLEDLTIGRWGMVHR
jgi:taurine transport system permease protein